MVIVRPRARMKEWRRFPGKWPFQVLTPRGLRPAREMADAQAPAHLVVLETNEDDGIEPTAEAP